MTGGDAATTDTVPCMACGRLLTDQESRRLRIGPYCLKRLQEATAPRPRTLGTPISIPHPQAVPVRVTSQLALELWDDDEDQDDEPDERGRRITDVPTGAFL